MLLVSTSACLCLFSTPDHQMLATTRSDYYEVQHIHMHFAGTLDFHPGNWSCRTPVSAVISLNREVGFVPKIFDLVFAQMFAQHYYFFVPK